MDPSFIQLIFLAIVCWVILVAYKAIYNFYLSPLSKIPGPLRVHVGDWWLLLQSIRFNRCFAVDILFQSHGPIVRIAANKVALNDADDIQRIYRGHTYKKSDWYKGFTFGGIHNNFSTSDPMFHAFLSKWSAPPFRKENLRRGEPAARQILEDLCRRIRDGPAELEVVSLFRLLALDMMGSIVLGCEFNQIRTGKTHPCVEDIDRFMLEKQLFNYLPGFVYKFLSVLPFKSLRDVFESGPRFLRYAEKIYNEVGEAEQDVGRIDILSTLKNYIDPKTGYPPPRELVISQVAAFLFAGADTTTVSVVYIAWEISRNTEVYNEMRNELEKAIPDVDSLPSFLVLRDLPYLSAVIMEGLRLWAPGQSMLERVVPPSGATHQGLFLPGGTVVAGQAWSAHRRGDVFPDPYVFRPERWLKEVNGNRVINDDVKMVASYFPFGIGLRGCIGRPLAEMELWMIISTLVRRFRFVPSARTTVHSMRPLDIWMIRPASHRCDLVFEYSP